MADLNKPAFEALYGSSGSKFPTNTSGSIKALDVREFGRDISDTFFGANGGGPQFRGNYDASSNAFPSTGGNHTGGAPGRGDYWQVTVDGTIDGVVVPAGSWIWARQNGPTSDWNVLTGWKLI